MCGLEFFVRCTGDRYFKQRWEGYSDFVALFRMLVPHPSSRVVRVDLVPDTVRRQRVRSKLIDGATGPLYHKDPNLWHIEIANCPNLDVLVTRMYTRYHSRPRFEFESTFNATNKHPTSKQNNGIMMMRILLTTTLLVGSGMAFAPQSTTERYTSSSTELAGIGSKIMGKFRKKREVSQKRAVRIGTKLPSCDVVRALDGEGVDVIDVLGEGKSILVGMPGAFTPVCTAQHLPGYIKLAPKLSALGYDTIACVTTNDRFVNEEWSKTVGLTDGDSPVTILCDGDGDLVKELGLAEDMGFGVGERSKRFALAAENGVVTHLLTDEGMDDCSMTSADSMLQLLTPEDAQMEEREMDGTVIGGIAAAGVALLLGLNVMGSGDAPSTASRAPASTPAAKVQKKTAATRGKSKSYSNFSLLKEYSSE